MPVIESFINKISFAFKPLIFMLVPLFITIGLIWVWKELFVNKKRRSPLNFELLRSPGYSLSKIIDDLELDIVTYLTFTMFSPMIVYSMYLVQTIDNPNSINYSTLVTYWVMGFVGYTYFLYSLIKLLLSRQKYRQALDGELATAQCLLPVIAGGGRIFHDFQAEGFNIDHVVVTLAGVFAVETKHRLKPTDVNAKDMAKLQFDGKILRFPNWVETSPIEQARRQAVWLSKFLTKSTGEDTQVKPVLAFPGWFVERTARSDVIVINPMNNAFMLKSQDGQPITDDRMKRICYQLEQRCQESAEAKNMKYANRA